MHLTGSDFMDVDDHNLPIERNLGDAFAVIVKTLAGHTAGRVAHALGLDRKTAQNALEGRAGVPVITRSLRERQRTHDDHYELWLAIGRLIFGETLDQYEERKLRTIIESTENAKQLAEARAERRRGLEARAFAVARNGSDASDRSGERAA